MTAEPKFDQCPCGRVDRVPVGEDRPYGWKRLRDGSLRCVTCSEKS